MPTIHTTAGSSSLWLTSGSSTQSTSNYGNPYMFTARRLDAESGLYYYRARMYHPDLGRFCQPDPIGYYDSMNLYQYCLNNPINWIDPYGLSYNVILGPGGYPIYIKEITDNERRRNKERVNKEYNKWKKDWDKNIKNGNPSHDTLNLVKETLTNTTGAPDATMLNSRKDVKNLIDDVQRINQQNRGLHDDVFDLYPNSGCPKNGGDGQ